jgi:PIN domain nuclease of toxin-antitoxin system
MMSFPLICSICLQEKKSSAVASRHSCFNFIPLAISVEHAVMVEQLPMHHQDPFDRILIAQGMYEQLVIITRDRQFDFYQVNTIKS